MFNRRENQCLFKAYHIIKRLGFVTLKEEEGELLQKELRDILIKYNTGLVSVSAKKVHDKTEVDYDELFQEGMIGLVFSVDRFDPSKNISFSSFAVPTIEGAIKHYVRDKSRTIKVPQLLQKLKSEIRKYLKKHPNSSVKTLSKNFNVSEHRIQEALDFDSFIKNLDE
jgi:RNA polymerase sigma factor (sigma-70 family)